MKDRKRNREFGIGERVVVNEKAPGGYAGKSGTVREIVLDSRCGVSFGVYLNSECLDLAPKVPSRAA